MKLIFVVLAAVLVAGGTRTLIALAACPADKGGAHIDMIMCRAYGTNWLEVFTASLRNHTPNQAMRETYDAATGRSQVQ